MMTPYSAPSICFLLLSTMASVVLCSDPVCPSGCKCFKENREPFGTLLTVTCKELTNVPDLSVLRDTKMGKNLRLDGNFIEEVTENNFPAGLNITMLNLSRNKGLQISNNAFLNLGSSLKILKAEAIDMPFNNTLTMFDPLFSLKELSLSYNNKHPYVVGAVQDIDFPLFEGEVAKSIVKLKLAFCGIRSMTASTLDNLKKLEELDASNNWFKAVPDVVKHLPTLTFLELFYCTIESIEDNDFSSLTNLKELDLSSNRQLSSIGEKAFVGCENSLEKLLLSRCHLSEVPTASLQYLKKLNHLDISENKFTNILPGAFEGDYKLKELLISAPDMQFSPDMFQGQEENIIDLSIVRMDLNSIPREAISKLKNLGRLSLDHNKITVLPPKAFEGISATKLYLGNNPLAEIDKGAFDGMQPHLVINLRNTHVEDIDFLLGYPESAIETVNLDRSKLACRCSMKSSLNVTFNVRIYGSCNKNDKQIPISSNKLETILEEACEEEREAGNTGAITRYDNIKAFLSLGIATTVVNYFHSNRESIFY